MSDHVEENMELKSLYNIVGVAVQHEKHGIGETIDVRSDKPSKVKVEFGRAGVDGWFPVDDLKVDEEYYNTCPDHATPAVKEALELN